MTEAQTLGAREDAISFQRIPQETDRTAPKGTAVMAIVLDDFMTDGHGFQRYGLVIGFRGRLAFGDGKQGQEDIPQRLYRP